MTAPATTWPPAPTPPVAGGRRLPPWLEVLRDTVRRVLVEPVQDGAPRFRSWSLGLQLVAAIATVATFASALLAAFGSDLRQGSMVLSGTELVLPSWSMPVLLWLLVLAMALLYSAAATSHPAFYALVWFTVTPMWLSTPAVGVFQWLKWLTAGVALVLLLLPLVVRRRGWEAWQFVVVWLLLSVAVVLPLLVANPQRLAIDMRGITTMSLATTLTSVACPAIAAAGYSAIEVVVTSAQWFSHEVRDLGRRFMNRWLLALVLVTGLWRAWTLAQTVHLGEVARLALLPSLTVVVLTALLTIALWTAAPVLRTDRRNVWPVGLPSMLSEHLNPWVLPIGLVLAIPLYPLALAGSLDNIIGDAWAGRLHVATLHEWAGSTAFRVATRVLAASALLWFAWRQAQHNRPVLVPLAAALFVTQVMLGLKQFGVPGPWDWSIEGIGAITTAAGLVWLVLAAVRRRLHNGTLLAVWVVWLLAVAYQFRDYLDEPTTLLGGISVTLLVLAGVAWRLMTDGQVARGDSKAFPLASRVLLLLANALFATTALALTALAGGYNPYNTSDSWNILGENSIGGVLITCAMLAPFVVTLFTFGLDD